ncbi:unnamed protein product [Porites evermanni]|uniref:Uncharacterized protein n=1 Tax=Porites evermanni TaxID=104178 RepID=A0ABN8SH03_9CNID|nr:unnamed protein product [Porites evermanni]
MVLGNLRPQNNITTKCACEPTAAYIHVNTIDPGWMYTHWARDQDTLKIAWRYYSPSCLASLPNRFYIQIARKGTYGVYCNLRMKTPFIKEVAVWSHHGHHQGKTKYLFNYTLPYNSTNSTKPFHDVRFFKLVSLRKRSKLYAHLKLDIPDSWKEDIRALKFKNFLLNLFDNEVNNNNFGVFSIQ